MREDSNHVRRTFQVTEVTCMAQLKTGEARRIRCQIRGIWKDDKRLLELVRKMFTDGNRSISFIISKEFYRVNFDMPVETYIEYAEITGKEKIEP